MKLFLRKTGKPPEHAAARPRARGTATRSVPHQPVPVLTALDNSGNVFQAMLASSNDIAAALAGRIAAGSVLCSDGNVAYVTVADKARAEHYIVLSETKLAAMSVLTPQRLGLGRVNTHHQLLKYLINERCRGVATRYLCNYLGWHRKMARPEFEAKMLLSLALA